MSLMLKNWFKKSENKLHYCKDCIKGIKKNSSKIDSKCYERYLAY
jgi:hypothetical protein